MKNCFYPEVKITQQVLPTLVPYIATSRLHMYSCTTRQSQACTVNINLQYINTFSLALPACLRTSLDKLAPLLSVILILDHNIHAVHTQVAGSRLNFKSQQSKFWPEYTPPLRSARVRKTCWPRRGTEFRKQIGMKILEMMTF